MSILELRKILKSKKPAFFRQDSKKRKRIGESWRRPKGIQSKMRLKKKGHPKPISSGYRSPKEVRGMHKKGLFPVRVMNPEQVSGIDSKNEGIIIGKGTGLREKIAILEEAAKKGIVVLNAKIEKLMQKQEERKKEMKQKEEKGKMPKKEARKKQEAKKAPEMTEEEKKKIEKEEKDKLLTKRDI